VAGDERRLRQILINLIGNAVKFTDHGSVQVDVSFLKDQLTISISDTGPGIALDEIERLFEPFEQSQERPSQEGTGLGLPISRALARKMGGDVTVESAMGEGSTFRISIPSHVLEEPPVPAPGSSSSLLRTHFIRQEDVEDYHALRDAVRIGDLNAVRSEIDHLRIQYPDREELHAKLSTLVSEFDLTALQALFR